MSTDNDPQTPTIADPVQKLFDLVVDAFENLSPGHMATIKGIPLIRVSNRWWAKYHTETIPAEQITTYAWAPDDDDRAGALVRYIEDQIANEVLSISSTVLVEIIIYIANAEHLVANGSNYYNVEFHYMRDPELSESAGDSEEEHHEDVPL
jgi:hypothetical protein